MPTRSPGAVDAVVEYVSDEPSPESKARHMRVGRGLKLSGQITGCERLVVEGEVEAARLECSVIELAASGLFKGTATVDSAEISGRFEGTLTVRERLSIQETGKVSGEIKYGQLEVQLGGELTGTIGVKA
ncbi:MAG TPA: polymer-forming cytoskeletal protein [Aliidongia sp.]|nr:polymer-forming cytoskeletal protein [Aliidongia sp.]